MRERFSPQFEAAPHVEGLVASSVRDTGQHLEWSYYHPDDCTVDARHIRVRFSPDRLYQSHLDVYERSRPLRTGIFSFTNIPTMDSIMDAVDLIGDELSERRSVYGSDDERAVARMCVEGGFHHPGIFRDTWTLPSNNPQVLFYIRKPIADREVGDGQFIVTDSNGPITRDGWVEAGAARFTGTHRVMPFATTLEEAIDIVHAGEVQPQGNDTNPGQPRWLSIYTREWAREQAASSEQKPGAR